MEYRKLPDICDCDVKDKEMLAAFRACRSRWHSWTLRNDKHSIKNQLHTLLWDDTVFRMVNESRKLCSSLNDKSPGFNLAMLDLFDKGFVSSQIMSIRKITDKGFHDPQKQVISIVTTLNDMLKNFELITRENYVCYDGTSYLPSENDDSSLTFLKEHINSNFDKLSGSDKSSRKRNDVICKTIFLDKLKLLNACDDFRIYANKFIAHSSVPSVKRDEIERDKNITLNAFDKTYRPIIQVACFLSMQVLCECELGGLPVPQYDQAAGLDKGLLNTDDFEKYTTFGKSERQKLVLGRTYSSA